METSLRVALVLNPFSVYLREPLSLSMKWSDHAPSLARELLGRGHVVRGFGAPPGLVPRSGAEASEDPEVDGAVGPLAGGRLKQFRPDAIVAYDSLSPAAWRGARMARALGAALVLVEDALPGTGRPIQRALWRLGEILWGPLIRRTATAVVALDPLARGQALQRGFDERRIEVVPYGVDLSQFRPGLTSTLVARRRIRGRILLYVGHVAESRGLETLVAAFGRTVGQRSDWNLVIAGEGPLVPALRAMGDRLGIAARLHWIGKPRREELPGLMGASTLLAVPAVDESVVGKQIGRAMACGLPVLASDLPRMRSLVRNEDTGLLVRAGDVEAWTAAIQRAASSPVARRRWGWNAREYAAAHLAWSRVGERFESILTRACARVGEGESADAKEPVQGVPEPGPQGH